MRTVKICLALILTAGIMFIHTSRLYADDTSEAILKILIKKGIITQEEIEEMNAEISKKKAEKVAAVPEGIEERVVALEKGMPAWAQKIKLKGDLRLRHEDIYNEGNNTHRQRIRFRVGGDAKLNDKIKVAFRIATGSSDTPTSTNQTLEQEFQSKQIWLDYAYAKYDPFEWATLWGGKFASPFYHTDMLWDSDITFDGVAGKVTFPLFDKESDFPETDIHLIGGFFPLDERVGASEPNLFIVQGAGEMNFEDVAKLDAAVTMYYFDGMQGYTAFAESAGTNTRMGGGIAHDFHVVSPYGKLTFIDPFGIGVPLALIGEYANNVAAGDDDNAWRLGVQLGKGTKEKYGWKLLGQYSRIETDVFYDGFTDADFNSGGTNAKGWEIIFDYALWKNVILGIDYYYTESINGAEATQHTLESDVVFKF